MCPTQAGFVPRYGRRGLGQLAVSGEEGAVAIKNSKLDFLGCLSFVWRLSERLGLGGGRCFLDCTGASWRLQPNNGQWQVPCYATC